MSAKTYKCPHLNDRVTEGQCIGAKCNAESEEQCVKIRSMKRAVNPQCWKLKPAAAKDPKKK